MLDVDSYLSDDPKAEAARLIERAEKILIKALLSGSARPVRAAISFLKLKVLHLANLRSTHSKPDSHILMSQYAVTYQQLEPIARLLWSLFIHVSSDVNDETDIANSLSLVLKLLNKLPDCPPCGSAERLSIPWKPLYDSLMRVQMHDLSPEQVSVSSVSKV